MIQYTIYRLDENHLKESESLYRTEKRVCLIQVDLEGWDRNSFDSIEMALEYMKQQEMYYTDYTILPNIYLTSED